MNSRCNKSRVITAFGHSHMREALDYYC